MEIRRFYGRKTSDNISLIGDEYYHCTKVLRYKLGYDICAFTGDGNNYYAKIIEINSNEVVAKIYKTIPNLTECKNRIVLCQALCKEFDFIVQKAVELGVTEIVPFVSARTNTKGIKLQRIEKIILEAAKQSGRSVLPIIKDTVDFEEVLKLYPNYTNRMFCFEKSKDLPLSTQLSWINRDVIIVIGPEGGFTDDEVMSARKNDYKVAKLSSRILKSETAAIVAIISTQLKYEDL